MATANIGFEETLWKAADKLRGSMDAAEYKYVVLGLIFLKFISDKFENKYNELVEEGEGFEEDRDEYTYENIFWVPKESRWNFVKDNAKDPKIGQYIDDAMILIEKENPSLKGVLDKRYARPELDKRRLGELIDLISTIKLHNNGEKDLLGRVYEYFLGQFASSEGKGGGEFYTPTSVVRTLVEMIEPYEGRIYDPTCGSGGFLIKSFEYVREKIEEDIQIVKEKFKKQIMTDNYDELSEAKQNEINKKINEMFRILNKELETIEENILRGKQN